MARTGSAETDGRLSSNERDDGAASSHPGVEYVGSEEEIDVGHTCPAEATGRKLLPGSGAKKRGTVLKRGQVNTAFQVKQGVRQEVREATRV